MSQFRVVGGLDFSPESAASRGRLWKTDQNLFMPRIGFAYSLTPKTVIRGGYGMFFDALA